MTKKSVTKISTLIGWMDILDIGREAKKVRKRVLDFLDKLGVRAVYEALMPVCMRSTNNQDSSDDPNHFQTQNSVKGKTNAIT